MLLSPIWWVGLPPSIPFSTCNCIIFRQFSPNFFFLSLFLLSTPLFGFWRWSFSREPWTCWHVTMTHPSLDFFGPGISCRGDWLWQERGCIYSQDHIALISMKVSRPNECDTDSIVLLQDGTERLPTAHNSKYGRSTPATRHISLVPYDYSATIEDKFCAILAETWATQKENPEKMHIS